MMTLCSSHGETNIHLHPGTETLPSPPPQNGSLKPFLFLFARASLSPSPERSFNQGRKMWPVLKSEGEAGRLIHASCRGSGSSALDHQQEKTRQGRHRLLVEATAKPEWRNPQDLNSKTSWKCMEMHEKHIYIYIHVYISNCIYIYCIYIY